MVVVVVVRHRRVLVRSSLLGAARFAVMVAVVMGAVEVAGASLPHQCVRPVEQEQDGQPAVRWRL